MTMAKGNHLKGRWGFTIHGSRNGVGDVAGVGVFELDDDGNISDGKQSVSLGGQIAEETFSGTYDINDGVGTANIHIDSPIMVRDASFAVVVTDSGKQLRLVFTDQGTITIVNAT